MKIEITKAEVNGRVETGLIQFNDDWPGVFIRGDHALAYAADLRSIESLIRDQWPITAMRLRNLAEILSSCAVGSGRADAT